MTGNGIKALVFCVVLNFALKQKLKTFKNCLRALSTSDRKPEYQKTHSSFPYGKKLHN